MTRTRFTAAMRERFSRDIVELLRERGGMFMAAGTDPAWPKNVYGWTFSLCGRVCILPSGTAVRLWFQDRDKLIQSASKGTFGPALLVPRLGTLTYSAWNEATAPEHRVQLFRDWLDDLLQAQAFRDWFDDAMTGAA